MKAVYFIRAVETGHVKVGVSANPEARLRYFMAVSPLTLELLASWILPEQRTQRQEAMGIERRLHERYVHAHHRGEWFNDCREIQADVAAIRAGSFDPASLPTPTCASVFRKIGRHSKGGRKPRLAA